LSLIAGKGGDGAVSTRTRAQERPQVASDRVSTSYAQAAVRAPWYPKARNRLVIEAWLGARLRQRRGRALTRASLRLRGNTRTSAKAAPGAALATERSAAQRAASTQRHQPSRLEAIAATMPIGSASNEPETNANGERLIWLPRAVCRSAALPARTGRILQRGHSAAGGRRRRHFPS
jgi:hypothetical protein